MTGCLQIYTGDGKGKTTAATGLAVRAAGAGLRVFIGQFIKSDDSAEMCILRKRFPEITIEQFGAGGFITKTPSDADLTHAHNGIKKLQQALTEGNYDVVIADEANGALSAGIISLQELMSLAELRPDCVELVITGRNAHPKLIEKADLVTEMCNIKHCYDAGIPARRGIEY
jgi:cob(I)alamin adenosyltransferase